MKKIAVLLLVALMMLSICAVPAAAEKDTAILATSEEPYRFFAQSKQSSVQAELLRR